MNVLVRMLVNQDLVLAQAYRLLQRIALSIFDGPWFTHHLVATGWCCHRSRHGVGVIYDLEQVLLLPLLVLQDLLARSLSLVRLLIDWYAKLLYKVHESI